MSGLPDSLKTASATTEVEDERDKTGKKKEILSDHYRLMDLFERFTNYCKLHDVPFWLDWGTLLGGLRHGNIIPWDYDIDVCLMENDYHVLKKHLQLDNCFSLCYNFDYYKDDGCFCITWSDSDDSVGIDVECFRIDPENSPRLLSMMSKQTQMDYVSVPYGCTDRSLSSYDMNTDDVFPLKELLVLGKLVQIPNKPQEVLFHHYGPRCLEIPYHLEEYQNWLRKDPANSHLKELFLKPPFLVISSIKGNKDMISNQTLNSTLPVVLEDCADFQFTADTLKAAFLEEKKHTWGYPATNNPDFQYEYQSAETLITAWEKDTLKLNLVDTECYEPASFSLFPSVLKEFRPSYALSAAKNWTQWHDDGIDRGGGWMFLKVGKKVWQFITPSDMKYLQDHGYNYTLINKMTTTELVHLLDCYLWGKTYVAVMKENDFLFFPEGWSHSVYTEEKSFGISGYSKLTEKG
jgi:hypothetical protein